jgi:hypothetical protein
MHEEIFLSFPRHSRSSYGYEYMLGPIVAKSRYAVARCFFSILVRL